MICIYNIQLRAIVSLRMGCSVVYVGRYARMYAWSSSTPERSAGVDIHVISVYNFKVNFLLLLLLESVVCVCLCSCSCSY